jgi:hypothetical protein
VPVFENAIVVVGLMRRTAVNDSDDLNGLLGKILSQTNSGCGCGSIGLQRGAENGQKMHFAGLLNRP